MSVIPVLMYHSISDDGQKMSVSKHNFYKQAKIMLKLGFKSSIISALFSLIVGMCNIFYFFKETNLHKKTLDKIKSSFNL